MVCIDAGDGRVIRNRHGEACRAPDACPGCLPCPELHCRRCRREHVDGDGGPIACPRCVGMVRLSLAEIRTLYPALTSEAVNSYAARHNPAVPGADALVLASPGSAGQDDDARPSGRTAQLLHRFLFGLDLTHVYDERRNDPDPVIAVLTHWEDRTRRLLDQPTDLAPTLDRAADYLNEHLNDASRDLSFIPLAEALAATVRRLEDVLDAGDRPERSRVPCLECGTRLVKEYGASPEADYWACPRCGERYDRGRFERAKHDQLASEGADRFVSVPDAAAAIGRPVTTLRRWVRAEVVEAAKDTAGRVVVWWPDIRAAHLRAAERKRAK